MIVILSAMESEIRDLKRHMTIVTSSEKVCRTYAGQIGGIDCLLVLTGIGRHRAQQAAGFILANYPVSLLISTGFAGALSPKSVVGDIVVYSGLCCENVPGDLPPKALDCDCALVVHALKAGQQQKYHTFPGQGVTISQVCARPQDKHHLGRLFQADAVDMESYWIAEIARRKLVDFIVVRSISDGVEDDLSFLDHILVKGKFKLPEAMGYFLRHPAQLKKVAGLSLNFRKASRNLAVYLQRLLEALP